MKMLTEVELLHYLLLPMVAVPALPPDHAAGDGSSA